MILWPGLLFLSLEELSASGNNCERKTLGDTWPKTGNKIDFRVWICYGFAHFMQPRSEQNTLLFR